MNTKSTIMADKYGVIVIFAGHNGQKVGISTIYSLRMDNLCAKPMI